MRPTVVGVNRAWRDDPSVGPGSGPVIVAGSRAVRVDVSARTRGAFSRARRRSPATFARDVTESAHPGEARLHFRSPCKVGWPAQLEPIVPDAARIPVEALGTSLGGTFVVSDDLLPIGSDLHLWIHPTEPVAGSTIRVRARVRWLNDRPGRLPRGFGVEFRAMNAEGEIALHRCFSRMAKVV